MGDKSITINKRAGCGTLHVTISDGDETGKPIISVEGGKAGTCLASQLAVISYALTLARRCGATLEQIAEAVEGIACPQSLAATKGPTSCGDAISRILKSHVKEVGGV